MKDAKTGETTSHHEPVPAVQLRGNSRKVTRAGRQKPAGERIMAASRGGYSIPGISPDLSQKTLYERGGLGKSTRIPVADEHRETAITQYVMSNLYQHLEPSDTFRGKVVITGVQGELHQVGANMVADILESEGWDVMFLGTNVPPEGVIQAIRNNGANLFGISSTMFFNLPKVIHLVEAVRKEFGEQAPGIMLGGGAFRMLQQLPGELEGCRVALNLREALELTRRFIAPESTATHRN